MSIASALLRLCFVVLFGTMSLMHGPVMTYAGAHAHTHTTAAQGSDAPDMATHDHGGHDGAHDPAPPAKHATCNAFACFTAVEPLPVTSRPPCPILFAIMAAAPAPALDPLLTTPDLPPPRILS
jgi:hypothetical protein